MTPLVKSNPNWKRTPANAEVACFICGREVKARAGETVTWIRLTGDDHATLEQSETETVVVIGRECARKNPELKPFIGTGAVGTRHGTRGCYFEKRAIS